MSVNCTVCCAVREQPLYTLLYKDRLEKYLQNQTIREKRKFIEDNYKEYIHLGCAIFYLPGLEIISEKYYLTQDDCVIDYVLFGADIIHQSKSKKDYCSICIVNADESKPPQKKAHVKCHSQSCNRFFHIECIINVKKRITATKARVYVNCNKHFDKNQEQMDWNDWENISLDIINSTIFRRQEEPFKEKSRYVLISEIGKSEIIDEKQDSKFKRLDLELCKKIKVTKKTIKVENDKKRQKFWDSTKDVKSQYEFQPRALYSIDYSAKPKNMMINNQDSDNEIQVNNFKNLKEQYIINDDKVELNYIQPIKKIKKEQVKEKQENIESNKRNSIVNLDQLKQKESTNSNGFSINLLLDFVKENKTKYLSNDNNNENPNINDNSNNQNSIDNNNNNVEKSINGNNNIQNNFENKNLNGSINGKKQNDQEVINNYKEISNQKIKSLLNDNSLDQQAIIKNKNQNPKKKQQINNEFLIPNADMVDQDEIKQIKPLKKAQQNSFKSPKELMNYLLKPDSRQRRTDTSQQQPIFLRKKQQQEKYIYPQFEGVIYEDNELLWKEIEQVYFNQQKDPCPIFDSFKFDFQLDFNTTQQENKLILIFDWKQQTYLVEYEISDIKDQQQINNEQQQQQQQQQLNNIQIYRSQNLVESIELQNLNEKNCQQLICQTIYELENKEENLQIQQIINNNQQNYLFDLQNYYETIYNQTMENNQKMLRTLQNTIKKDKEGKIIINSGQQYIDQLKWFKLLGNVKKGFQFITEEDHKLMLQNKINYLQDFKYGSFAGKCCINNLNQEQKKELAECTCCKICLNYSNIQIDSNNDLLWCEQCWTTFHKNCYNFSQSQQKCDNCKTTNKQIQICKICEQNYPEIPLKLIDDRMVHIICALLNQNLCYNGPNFKYQENQIEQVNINCLVCEQNNGLKIKCLYCENQCHLLCSFLWGFQINIDEYTLDSINQNLNYSIICPKHQTNYELLQKQIYFRWHGINYKQSAYFETFESFVKGKLFSYQKILNRIIGQQTTNDNI